MANGSKFCIELPKWLEKFVTEAATGNYQSDADKVTVAINAARMNVDSNSGGPFGAAVFNSTGQLVSVGVNLVEPNCCSVLHAEVVALMLAQAAVKSFTLDRGEQFVLATSAAPCVMCFGAVHWSGVKRLVVSANKSDVEAIGFDEGPIPADWIARLAQSGIAVVEGCLREQAVSVLNDYSAKGATIYNADSRSRT